ncbi:hypothetical protein [Adhaeribacter radiodurans]|uniref:Uncharacterized protein n=1 Tax=Adhaeribacter radiodurans TaxID=2745197 RepID=A0A7L7L2I0_9BACT|nr:hypothetical protein [Adhaeribacter radiodurans]QMU27002.1 hypothetical protein HUW48_02675 [Adhaeribacter radiodurans]
MFSDDNQLTLPDKYKIILGVMLIAYGALRFYRSYKKNKPQDYSDEDN